MRTTTKTTEKKELHTELYSFVCSVVAVRRKLLKNDVSRRNKMQMWKTLTAIENLLMANRYDDDRLMAGFFIRHMDDIESLIPGEGSKLRQNMGRRFTELKSMAINYYLKVKPQIVS